MTDATMANRICELYAAGQRVAIRRYEQADSREVATRLSPVVTELLAGGSALVEEIVARLASTAIRVTGPLAAGAAPPVADPDAIAASAAAELQAHQQRLARHGPGGDVRAMLADCGVALRALQRSLQAIEPPVCQLENVLPSLPQQLQVSLAVRRHYRALWIFHAHVGALTAGTSRQALRAVGTRIAILAGSDVFSLLREDDQLTLRELQARILAWLREESELASAVSIWQAFSQLVEVLRKISQREELIAHDRHVIAQAIAELEERSEDALPEVSKALLPVLGFDDALDEVIQSNPSARSLLHELRRALRRAPVPGQ